LSENRTILLTSELVETIREAAIRLEHDGRSAKAVRLLERLLKAGNPSLQPVEKARLGAALGGMVWKQGHVAKARGLAAAAVELAEESGDAGALSEALFALGEVAYIEAVYMGRGELGDAMAHHRRALDVRRETGDRRGASLSLSRIGVIHERMDEHDEARACYEEALRIAEELDFPEGMSRPFVHLGAAKERAGDLAGALADYRRSVAAVRRAHDVHALAFDLCNVASAAYRLDGELEPAIERLREALDLAEGMGFKLAELRVHQVTGDVYAAAGRTEDARREYEAAIGIGVAAGFERFADFVRERLDAAAE
jgi:tetratricopeptide (TPR) repeat protein